MCDCWSAMNKRFLNRLILICAFLIPANILLAQDIDPTLTGAAAAKQFFDTGNYKDALREYLKLLKDKPADDDYNYRVGVCYLNLNIDKTYAISYLKQTVEKDKHMPEALYELGLAYHYSDSLDKAIECYSKYKTKTNDGAEQVKAVRQIEMCNSAKKFMAVPLNVTFQNLGKKVNSDEPDYNPLVPANEDFLVFSTKRKQATGGNNDYDGFKPADIFYSDVDDGEFGRVKSVGALINTEWVEEVAGLSANGDYLLVSIDNFDGFDDIWISEIKKKGNRMSWQKSYPVGPPINSEEAETTGSLSPDGQSLYFARTPLIFPGFGGTDIYVARKLPDGSWTEPVNLGPTINTQYDEDFPQISSDGKILYFASKGHNSMGGYDVFRSRWDDKLKRWSRPENLGYPLNNTMDNFTFSLNETGRHGYVSALRPEGLGDLDIYRVIFNDVEQRISAVVGQITLIEAPEKNAITWHIYEKDGRQEKFCDIYLPDNDPSWKFVKTEEEEIPDGYSYLLSVIAEVDGQVGKFQKGAVPSHNPTFKFMRLSSQKVRVAGFKKAEPKTLSLKDRPDLNVSITVTNAETGDLYGTYTPNRKTGNYTLAMEPGFYEMEIMIDGYQTHTQKLNVYDKSEYQMVITRDITMYDENLPPIK